MNNLVQPILIGRSCSKKHDRSDYLPRLIRERETRNLLFETVREETSLQERVDFCKKISASRASDIGEIIEISFKYIRLGD